MNKPPYRIPLMAEIGAVPWNGFRAASLFAGCGGSSLGYRMAGYRMMWASEFVPAAADAYAANKDERTILDRRDIRDVDPRHVLAETGLAEGQLDLLDGSPPCASFSMAGKRAALWGEVKNYSDTRQRVDDLFGEYLRIAAGLRPKVCVAENVQVKTQSAMIYGGGGGETGFSPEIMGRYLKWCADTLADLSIVFVDPTLRLMYGQRLSKLKGRERLMSGSTGERVLWPLSLFKAFAELKDETALHLLALSGGKIQERARLIAPAPIVAGRIALSAPARQRALPY